RKGDGEPLCNTVERLERALDELAIGAPRARPPAVIAGLVHAAELIVLHEVAGRKKLITELTFERARRGRALPGAIAAARLRRLAIYLVAVELEVSNADLGRALDMTRQNVQQARNAIEDLRERPAVDAVLDRCRALLKGENYAA